MSGFGYYNARTRKTIHDRTYMIGEKIAARDIAALKPRALKNLLETGRILLTDEEGAVLTMGAAAQTINERAPARAH